jgi:hypothetical protein
MIRNRHRSFWTDRQDADSKERRSSHRQRVATQATERICGSEPRSNCSPCRRPSEIASGSCRDVPQVTGTERLVGVTQNETDAEDKERCKTERQVARFSASIEYMNNLGDPRVGEALLSLCPATNQKKRSIRVRSSGSIDLERRQGQSRRERR